MEFMGFDPRLAPPLEARPMEQIRVSTFAGPGAAPVIRAVSWPNVPKNAKRCGIYK